MSIVLANERNSNLLPSEIRINRPDGLPNSLREALLQKNLGDSALLLDAIYLSGWTAFKKFTRKQLLNNLLNNPHGKIDVPDGIIHRALNSGIFAYRRLRRLGKGRPEHQYTVPEIGPLLNHYANGTWTASDPLYPDDFRSLKIYRVALHRALIERHPGAYSREFLGKRLGVSKRTVRNYDRAAGIVVTARYKKIEIGRFINWQDFLIGKHPGGAEWLEFIYPDGVIERKPIKIGIVWKLMHLAAVYIVKQLTNYYELAVNIAFEDDPTQLKLAGDLPY
jgi:hypothetical protein